MQLNTIYLLSARPFFYTDIWRQRRTLNFIKMPARLAFLPPALGSSPLLRNRMRLRLRNFRRNPLHAQPRHLRSIVTMSQTIQQESTAENGYSTSERPPPLPDALSSKSPMAPRYDPQSIETELYEWWEKAGFFKPCPPNGQEPFVICMPPPNVTGVLHMGHAMFATIEDILTRYNRMRGRPTLWLPGADHAGIATQLVVEKQLAAEGLTRVEMGRKAFVDRVWKWKEEKGDYISQQMRRLGSSCDWDRNRFTLEENMSGAVSEAFKRLHDQGLVYRGDYMVNWSPNLQTAVSDLEVETVEENGKLYYFKYPLADGSGYIPVATTRPETILGDTAVCVHPEDDRYRAMAGKEVVVPTTGRRIPVITDSYVDREFGTGALKITPGHDYNDYELGKKHSLPIINIMNKDATINDNGGQFVGMDRFEARKQLWKAMEGEDLVIKVEDYVTRVPRSQRGGEIVEPLVSTQWFVKMKPLAEKAVDAVRNGDIAIVPNRFEKVYYNWLDNIRDWCVSRQLWWGHRIPVWYISEYPDEYIVARNDEEAKTLAAERYPGEAVHLKQETDVLDTWFSSGLWPFSTMGWPDEKADDLLSFFPGSILETGYDILFFWVARMIMMSLWLTDKVPFHTVYLHGLVRDKNGRKMSKSLGNVIDPLDVITEYGTDALRYSLVTGSTPGQDIPLSNEKVESNRNFTNKLWNAARFIIGNLSEASEEERRTLATIVSSDFGTSYDHLALPERYIIAQLHILVDKVQSDLDALSFGDAGRLIYEFLWDEFADWYVEIAKTRFFADDEAASQEARATLVYVMDTCLRLLHPFMPYVTEAIWHRFPRDGSSEYALITANWPSGGHVDHDAIHRFERLQSLVRYIRNARAEYQVEHGTRIPLSVRAEAVTAADVEKEQATLFLLSKVDPNQFDVEVVETSASEEQTDSDETFLHLYVADGLEGVIPFAGMIDLEKERKRLEKQYQKVQKDLEGLNKRLSAPGFSEKAPAAVVTMTKKSAEELDSQLESLSNRLAEIENIGNPE